MSKDRDKVTKEVTEYVEKTLRDNFIKNIMMGFNTANEMILHYINDGHDIDEVKDFIERNISPKGKKAMEKVMKIGVAEEIDTKKTKKKNKKGKGE